MATLKTRHEEAQVEPELGDETFMSAADLRTYMTEMQMARATKSIDGMDRAGKAREALIKQMAEPVDANACEGCGEFGCSQSCGRRRQTERRI